ncbi:MAG: glycosyltransferase [Coxiellaceae bacterium]|nr:glycosyltransferase [Coxiellaceae bacterium]
MKILQVISHYQPAVKFGGPLQVAHGLGKSLVEQGHEVTVCCTSMQDPQQNLAINTREACEIDGVKVFYLPTMGLRYWGFSPGLLKKVYVEAKKADVIFTHFHYQFASVIGGWCARMLNKPHVVFTHGCLNRHGVMAKRPKLKQAYLRCLETGNFKSAVFTAYHSETEQQQSLAFGGQTAIVPIGIDTDLINHVPRKILSNVKHLETQNKFVFTYLGRLAPGKGLDLLLTALHALVSSGYDPYLRIIGGDERGYCEQLKNQIVNLQLGQRVLFTGVLNGEEKFQAMAEADAFVLPSRSEGTSIATLEAMALGIPVIITDRVGLSKEVIQEKCGIVVPYESHALAGAMQNMLRCESRKGMGQRGSDYVRKKYDWSKISKDLLNELSSAQMEL